MTVCRQPDMLPDVLRYQQWWETLDGVTAAERSGSHDLADDHPTQYIAR